MKRNLVLLAALLFGLGSSLFAKTPFGHIAMFDFAAFFLGPLLFMRNFGRFTREEKRILLMALIWLAGSVWANLWRGEEADVALKGNAIVFNIWCMLVLGIVLIKYDYRTWLWFSVGNGISVIVSLYWFQNGALLSYAERAGYMGSGGLQHYLIEKQVYPLYYKAVVNSLLLPLVTLFRFPLMPTIVIMVAASFGLLIEGGSRSTFGVGLLNSMFFVGYATLAKSGRLGESEQKKYEVEFVEGDGLRDSISQRGGFSQMWADLKVKPFGYGGAHSVRHSAISDALHKAGVLAAPYWIMLILMFTSIP